MLGKRSGFTLVELLVVITIIGILVGLLLPAVQAVRETGRRTVCENKVKEMATACMSHESKYGFLPTGGWGFLWAGEPNLGFTNRQPGGWHFNILPFLDMGALHDMGLITPYTPGNQDKVAGQQRARTCVAMFNCPSRRHMEEFATAAEGMININDPGAATSITPATPLPPGVGRSDYAANSGDSYADVDPGNPNTGYDPSFDWSSVSGTVNSTSALSTGVIFRASMIRFAQIKSSASTYLLGERYGQPDHYYYTGEYQCDDDQGWDQGYDWDTNRFTYSPPRRDTPSWNTNNGVVYHDYSNWVNSCNDIFGSAHPAGFNMAFCDGSVRLVNFTIALNVHKQFGNRKTGGDLSQLF
jgi:prepilin-type N-terminal cleavage/methylation domain-containing protein/prepilin-type processing-associated H-X9-DG protein